MAGRTTPSRRRNGLSPPYSGAQISAWIALFGSYVQFILFITPVLPLMATIPATLYFSAVVAAVIYFGGKTQLVDPVDIHLANSLRRNPDENDPYFPNNNNNKTSVLNKLYQQHNLDPTLSILPHEEMKQCWICDTMVAEHSMHCKFCNKCVYHFDHHCLWLNTCIGSANYMYFFRTMQLLFLMEVSHLVIQVTLLLESFLGDSNRLNDWLKADLEPFVQAVYIFFIIFNGISIIMIGQLLSFHMGLQRDKITTYQFIVEDHRKKREEMKRMDDLNEKRLLAMAEANRQGQELTAFRLRVGGFCRNMGCAACDPMDLPVIKEPDPAAGFAAALGSPPVLSTLNEGEGNDYSATAAPGACDDDDDEQEENDEKSPAAPIAGRDEENQATNTANGEAKDVSNGHKNGS